MLHILTEEGEPAYATVTVKGKAVVWEADRKSVQKFFTSEPKYALALMASLAAQVRQSSKIVRALAQQ
jgi:CRP-like cAMP-binding protein